MAGNSFGQQFVVTTAGASHGPALVAIVDGCPPGMPLSEADIQPDLDRRRPGQSKQTTQRNEADQARILSGVFEGMTTGDPITLLIENVDAKPRDYHAIKNIFRPGHADFTYHHKYSHRDHRGGGRASARETAVRVAAGAIAKKYLALHFGTQIRACVTQIGKIAAAQIDWQCVEKNDFYFGALGSITDLETYIHSLRRSGDSIGARILVEATQVPIGLGEPVFDRLDADISKALMSINAAKAVAIGDGFDVVTQRGTEHRDEIRTEGFQSNHAGGILGGISTGQTIRASVAFKPASSIVTESNTITTDGEEVVVSTKGRHDPCVGIRAVPVVEAMLALVLMDHVLRVRGQCGLCGEKNDR
jgi:chorismate synthase